MPLRRLLAVLSIFCPVLVAQVNPAPQISQPLSPSAAVPGTSSVSLFVNGAGFVPSSTIQWNGSARTTTFVSATQLSTTLSASDLSVAETASVTVVNPAPGGGTSNVAFFEVRLPISPPAFVNTNLSTGLGPRFAAAADFNGDGRLDLAIVNKTGNSLSILLGIGGGMFASHVDYSVGTTPNSIAIGDFNGDGKADLAVTDYASANVSVLLGNGDGTFQNQVNYATGPNPESAAIGDFNRDGHLDIVTADKGSTTLSVLLGNGDGTFQGKVDYQAGMGPFSVTIGDFNRDGILDLACVNQSGNSVSVLLGNGDGSFQTHTDFTVGTLPQGIATADLNGDGILDLVTANTTSGTVSVLLGNGNGTFQTHVDYAAGGASSVTIVDINGDGIQDLAVAGGSFVEYLQGNGNGTFQPYILLETIATPMNVAAGDFDGDGRMDMAAPTLNSNSVAVMVQSFAKLSATSLVFPNQAVGTTSTPQNVTLTNTSPYTLSISAITIVGNDSTEFAQTNNCGSSLAAGAACTISVTFSPITVGSLTATLSFSDNGGFSPQLISLSGTGVAIASPFINDPLIPHVASPGGSGFTLTVNGSGFFPGATVYWNGSARTTTFVSDSQVTAAITAADISKAVVAIVTSANPGSDLSNAAYFDITQSTTSVTLKSSTATVGSGPRWAASADFNLDGKIDLAIANSTTNTVSVLLGNGDGTFKSHVDYATGKGPGFVAAGDFNGDGKVDLATANGGASSISILLGNGDGTFQTHVDYLGDSGPSALQIGDFNQDGILDIAVVSTGVGKIRIFLGDGDGTFKDGATYVTAPTLNHLAAGDLNADGKLDLVATNYNESKLYVFIGNGDGTFTQMLTYATGTNPKSVALADVNGDGKLDATVANYSGNSVSVLLGNGDGTFQTGVAYTTGSAPRDIEVSDFNGDGFLDIAVPDYNANKASILLGNGNGTFQAHLDFSTGGSPSSISMADYNGDGRLDLVTPNYTSNSVSILLQSPAVSLSPTSLAFGNQKVGTKSQPKIVTVTNTGSASFLLQSIQFTGTNNTDFAQTNTCSGSINPGASCTVGVTFTPGAKGSRSATMNINDNAANSPQKVPLSGTGT